MRKPKPGAPPARGRRSSRGVGPPHLVDETVADRLLGTEEPPGGEVSGDLVGAVPAGRLGDPPGQRTEARPMVAHERLEVNRGTGELDRLLDQAESRVRRRDPPRADGEGRDRRPFQLTETGRMDRHPEQVDDVNERERRVERPTGARDGELDRLVAERVEGHQLCRDVSHDEIVEAPPHDDGPPLVQPGANGQLQVLRRRCGAWRSERARPARHSGLCSSFQSSRSPSAAT